MDVSDWLRELGLERYGPVFRDNEIDWEVIPDLTEGDLKDLGLPLGPRKKLLKAIAALSKPEIGREVAVAHPEVAAREAERRQLTVMFVDLVGSTALSARLDPEDMREVMRAYQDACAGVITRFEGHVARYLGDGVLAYFGWPRSHEDEAERAVRVGLALVESIPKLATPADAPLAARIGIATGLVVVGDLIGEQSSEEHAVVGDTPNLAARLQALAAPNQVVVAEPTRRLLNAAFDLEDLGQQTAKGLPNRVGAFAVTGERPMPSRFEARASPTLLPMVGRDQELGLLLERWARAKAGEGQGVLLVGEAGIGKSRIVRALLDALADEPHTRVRYQCSPYHTDSALWPVIQQLGHATGFGTTTLGADDSPEARLDKLEAMLNRAGGHDAAPLLADLLGLDGTARYGELNLTPQAKRARSLEALVQQLLGLAARQPVLVVLEDAHWIDPTTLELIEHGLGRIAAARVLMVLTSRPNQQPDLAAHPHITRLSLNRLGRAGVEAIVARLSGAGLPSAIVEAIIARTDGVPLFVEELTKAVLETGETTIPTSLHDTLMARLDRIPEVKEIAQIAACLGREFNFALLAAVAERPEPDLTIALDRLASAQLIFRRGTPPDAAYTFKHALVRDAAYQSLLKSRREWLHAKIAEDLESRFPDIIVGEPETLAQHLTAAGLIDRAIPCWRRAGELAAGRSANVEAIAHMNKGLELIGTRQKAAEHLDEELELLLAIGGPLMATRGYSGPQVQRTYSRAWALCQQLGRSTKLFPGLRGLWNYYLLRGELQRAYDFAKRLVVLADEERNPVHRALAHRARGTALFFLGRFTDAVGELDEGIAIDDEVAAREENCREALLLYTERAGIVCRLYSAWVLWFLGFPERAAKRMEAGLALGESLAHANSLAFARIWAAELHIFRREFGPAQRRAQATIDLACQHHMSEWLAEATICRGFALSGLGRQTEGIADLRAGLTDWNRVGAHLFDAQWLAFLAEAHLQSGQLDDALTALDRAAEINPATGVCHYQSELCRLRGAVMAEAGDAAEAASWFQRAIDTARSQQAKSLELRSATSLARLWGDQGERRKAHDLLAPVYGWFTEGFDTQDLIDAKHLLDELI